MVRDRHGSAYRQATGENRGVPPDQNRANHGTVQETRRNDTMLNIMNTVMVIVGACSVGVRVVRRQKAQAGIRVGTCATNAAYVPPLSPCRCRRRRCCWPYVCRR